MFIGLIIAASISGLLLFLIFLLNLDKIRAKRITKKRDRLQEELNGVLRYMAQIESSCKVKDINYIATHDRLANSALYYVNKIRELDSKLNKEE